MADGLLHDLPRDLPTFLERFGTDEDCRAYLVQARWPAGFGRSSTVRAGIGALLAAK